MRIVLILDAIYILNANRTIKYKMTPTKYPNNDFAILL